MPDIKIRFGSTELANELREVVTRNLRKWVLMTSEEELKSTLGIEQEVDANQLGDDENVDLVKIALSMITSEHAHRQHAKWRSSIAAIVCQEIRDAEVAIETIEVQLLVGGRGSGAVYVVVTGEMAGPEWVDPFFDHPYPYPPKIRLVTQDESTTGLAHYVTG